MLSIGLALVAACVPPRVIQYTPFQDREFSERKTPAAVQDRAAADLLKSGYLLIGYIDLRRNVRTCYEDNQCVNHSDVLPSRDELQREAALHGGDVLTLLEDRTVIEPRNKSFCTNTTTTTVTVNKIPQVTTICTSYATVRGKLEAKISRALIWRHDPEAARGDANARAIEAALKTIEAAYQADPGRAAGNGSALSGLFSGFARRDDTVPGQTDALSRQVFVAIQNNDSALLYTLARHGELQNWTDDKKRTALMVAVLMDRFEAARTLLAIDRGLERRDSYGMNAIQYAVARGDLALVQDMVKAGYDVRRKADHNTSLLYFATWNPKTDIFEWLVRQGLDPRERTDEGDTLLIAAASNGGEALVRRLLELGVDVNLANHNGATALMAAAAKGQLATVQVLLKAGARTDPRDHLGNTALHAAATGGKREVVQALLQSGMDINARNEKGAPPLMVALATEKWDAARYLMDRGAALTTDKISAEDTAQFLIMKNQPQLLQRYLTAFPPLRELVRRDPNWLEYAAKKSGRDTIRFMADLGARINHAGTDGQTPLMTASSEGNVDAVRALMELKADATARDARNQTALKKATLMGHAKVVETLREFGVRE